MKGPERIETVRLVLRKPAPADAEAIFSRYASDPEVTRYLGWPRHHTVEQTKVFLAFSDAEWTRWPAGPYLIESRADGRLLGSTGLGFQTPATAMTGYVLARDAWGQGYATEAFNAIVTAARDMGVRRLHAVCHPRNTGSAHVLEKCAFTLESSMSEFADFPNLEEGRGYCLRYGRDFA